MTQTPLTLRRCQRAESERLVSLGVFRGEPVELIGGQLLVAEPQSRSMRRRSPRSPMRCGPSFPRDGSCESRRPCRSTTTRSRNPIWPSCGDVPATIDSRTRRGPRAPSRSRGPS